MQINTTIDNTTHLLQCLKKENQNKTKNLSYHVLRRMWSNWNSRKLLVGIQNARVNLVILCQLLMNLIHNYPTPSYLPWRNKNHVHTKSCIKILTGTSLISSENWGKNPYLFQLMNKQCVEYSYSRILLSNKNSKLWIHMTSIWIIKYVLLN